MIITKIALRNFKGAANFYLTWAPGQEGGDVEIYGDNGTGKTTVFDGFMWALFGKDSLNRANFEIKPLDPEGKPLPGLDNEAEVTIDGTTLKKIQKEKWVKQRGSADAAFQGHTVDHQIDGVPVQKKEYDAKIQQLATEDTFRLLTDPRHFNENLNWKERREILIALAGDITEEEVIEGDKKLAGLKKILDGRKIDDHRKVLMAQKKEINKELEAIPVRIDEANRVGQVDTKELEGHKNYLQGARDILAGKRQEIVDIESGRDISSKKKQLAEIEGKIQELKNKAAEAEYARTGEAKEKIRELKNALADSQSERTQAGKRLDQARETEQIATADVQAMRTKWTEIDKDHLVPQPEGTCYACGQDLPEDQIEAAKEKAIAEFNQKKAARLEEISGQGKRAATTAKAAAADCERIATRITELDAEIADQEKAIREAEGELSQAEPAAPDPQLSKQEEYRQKTLDHIAKIKADAAGEITRVEEEIEKIEIQVAEADAVVARARAAEEAQARIEDLKARERELAKEYEGIEKELFLAEDFKRAQAKLLETRINAKFDHATFKLFKTQVNGGIEEVCETLFKGVPYSAGLNNGARINIGLDIINALARNWEKTAPIFIDQREAVTKLIPTEAQTISLVVSEKDKALRIEHIKKGAK